MDICYVFVIVFILLNKFLNCVFMFFSVFLVCCLIFSFARFAFFVVCLSDVSVFLIDCSVFLIELISV